MKGLKLCLVNGLVSKKKSLRVVNSMSKKKDNFFMLVKADKK